MKYIVKLEEPNIGQYGKWRFNVLDEAMEFARDQIKTAKAEAVKEGFMKFCYICFGIYREDTGILYKICTDASGDPLVVMY